VKTAFSESLTKKSKREREKTKPAGNEMEKLLMKMLK